MYALANGYLLSAIILASLVVHLIEGSFHKAASWLSLASLAASIGLIHSPTLNPCKANQLFPAVYLLGASVLWLAHLIQNRAEQIREMQDTLTSTNPAPPTPSPPPSYSD